MAIKALIGLGNSGKEYEHTYHNIGAYSLADFKQYAARDGIENLLYKEPTGFMNESGRTVRQWMAYHNLSLDTVIIIHDDSDLDTGTYKLVRGGQSAGHKGIESIINELGTEDFWRLRIGIRDPKEPVRKKALDFVLRRFGASLEPVFEDVLKRAWADIKTLILG